MGWDLNDLLLQVPTLHATYSPASPGYSGPSTSRPSHYFFIHTSFGISICSLPSFSVILPLMHLYCGSYDSNKKCTLLAAFFPICPGSLETAREVHSEDIKGKCHCQGQTSEFPRKQWGTSSLDTEESKVPVQESLS